MKKWKAVVAAVVSVLVIAGAGAASVYHFYIVPKYIEPVLETAAYILNDNSVKDEISQIAEELREQGLLDENVVSEFVSTVKNEEGVVEKTTQEIPQETPPTEETEAPQTSGRKYSYGKKTDSNSKTDIAEETKDTQQVQSTPKPQSTADSLYERVKAQVSAEDLKKGYGFLGKLDLGTIRSLVSDRAALKKYIRNTLTNEEYAELIGLYIKYSYLLNE